LAAEAGRRVRLQLEPSRAGVTGQAGEGWDGTQESELIEAARRGDNAAFDELVSRHMKRAFALAHRLLGHREDAEDLVQDAFVAAIQNIDRFDTRRAFGPWMMRIVFNRAMNLRKSRARRQTEEIPETTAGSGASPLELAERSELAALLETALAKLPERRRWIVEMFEVDGFSGPEIAEILEMPEGTVRWELHQARATLRAVLESTTRRSV
jgi:RNA polymerase sigma-70 factor (ECF subfamily)